MVSEPFRDSTASLLRRIDELERANRRLRSRAHQSFFSDLGAFLRALCRLVATMLCVVGIMILGFIALGFVVAIFVGIVGFF